MEQQKEPSGEKVICKQIAGWTKKKGDFVSYLTERGLMEDLPNTANAALAGGPFWKLAQACWRSCQGT